MFLLPYNLPSSVSGGEYIFSSFQLKSLPPVTAGKFRLPFTILLMKKLVAPMSVS